MTPLTLATVALVLIGISVLIAVVNMGLLFRSVAKFDDKGAASKFGVHLFCIGGNAIGGLALLGSVIWWLFTRTGS